MFIDKFDFQLLRAALQCSASASGNHASTNPRGMRQTQTLSIMRVKRFDFLRRAIRQRKQRNTASRDGPIYIHQKYRDLLCPLCYL